MSTTFSRYLPILVVVVATAHLFTYDQRARAQTQLQPSVAPTSSSSNATTTSSTSTTPQPVAGQATGQTATPNQTNQPAVGAQSTSPSALRTFQMQTPSGGGTPQTAGVVVPGTQPTGGQSFQPMIAPQGQPRLNQQIGPRAVAPGRTNFAVPTNGQLQTTLGQSAVPVFLPPGIGFDVTDQGLMINSLEPTGLFFDSGLRRGDVIVSALGRPVLSEADFVSLAGSNPNEPIPLVILREGQLQTINVMFPLNAASSGPRTVASQSQVPGNGGQAYLGVEFNVQIANMAVVSAVIPKSPAEVAGLRAGDTITGINGEPIRSYQHALRVLRSVQPGEGVDISFSRWVDNQTRAILTPPVEVQTATSETNVRPH